MAEAVGNLEARPSQAKQRARNHVRVLNLRVNEWLTIWTMLKLPLFLFVIHTHAYMLISTCQPIFIFK